MQDTKSAWTMKERGMKNEEPATQCEKESAALCDVYSGSDLFRHFPIYSAVFVSYHIGGKVSAGKRHFGKQMGRSAILWAVYKFHIFLETDQEYAGNQLPAADNRICSTHYSGAPVE